MRQKLNSFVRDLIATEQFSDEEDVWVFEDGTHCAVCTNGARLVASHFKGIVCGYRAWENTLALIGEPHCSGHDFALIRERWLVDYWAFRVASLAPKAVLDLQLPTDRILARNLYGAQRTRQVVWSFEDTGIMPSDHPSKISCR